MYLTKALCPEYMRNYRKKTNNSIKIKAKYFKRYFTREDIQLANKHVNRWSTY